VIAVKHQPERGCPLPFSVVALSDRAFPFKTPFPYKFLFPFRLVDMAKQGEVLDGSHLSNTIKWIDRIAMVCL